MNARKMTRCSHVVSIQKTPDELFARWHDPAELPRIVRHVETWLEHELESSRSAAAEGQAPEPWLEIVRVDPPHALEWLARAGDEIRYRGIVTFRPAPIGRGTEVRLSLHFDEASGPFEKLKERLRADPPDLLLREDLRNFKQLAETGECPTTRGQPAGQRSRLSRKLMEAVEDRLQRELRIASRVTARVTGGGTPQGARP